MAVAIPRSITPPATHDMDHTRRHIALRLLPFLFILYIVNYLDRTSVAYAGIGMSRDLGFSDRVLGMGIGIFFVSYVALQIPGALLVERWSARRMISATMITWGFLTSLTALVHTPTQLYLARFALGVAEAGFFPGVIVYLSHWFAREDRAKATSNFMAAIPMSFVIGSPVAGWILGRGWFGLEGWRWLFVVEGMPAILLGGLAFFLLTDWPLEAGWLTPEQRLCLQQKLAQEQASGESAVKMSQALKSPAVLLLSSIAFLNYFVLYSFAFWFPAMLKRQSGLSDAHVGILGAIPYVVALIAMQINGWHSDKTRERRWHSALPLFAGVVGLIVLIGHPHSTALSLLAFTVLCSAFAYLPTSWAIPTEILSQSAAAASVGLINGVGSVAGFAGPYAFGYLNTRMGSFSYGLALMMISAIGGGLLTLCIPKTKLKTVDVCK